MDSCADVSSIEGAVSAASVALDCLRRVHGLCGDSLGVELIGSLDVRDVVAVRGVGRGVSYVPDLKRVVVGVGRYAWCDLVARVARGLVLAAAHRYVGVMDPDLYLPCSISGLVAERLVRDLVCGLSTPSVSKVFRGVGTICSEYRSGVLRPISHVVELLLSRYVGYRACFGDVRVRGRLLGGVWSFVLRVGGCDWCTFCTRVGVVFSRREHVVYAVSQVLDVEVGGFGRFSLGAVFPTVIQEHSPEDLRFILKRFGKRMIEVRNISEVMSPTVLRSMRDSRHYL